MEGIAVNRVHRDLPAPVVIEFLSRVWVHVKPREVATGNVEADPVAALKNQRCRIHLDGELVGFAGLEQLCLCRVIAVSCSYDAIRNIQFDACGKVRVRRVHIDELGREVRIQSVRGCPQLYDEPSRDFEILGQWRSLKHDDIAASGEGFRIRAKPEVWTASLIRRTRAHQIALGRDGPANGRHWISWIEGVIYGLAIGGYLRRKRAVCMKVVLR